MFAKDLQEFDLLKHNFYHAWECGLLSQKDLKEYCCQYFNHVNETPRYLSTMHAGCTNISVRQVILDNLIDEEKGEKNHPELWLKFCDAIDIERGKVLNAKLLPTTKNLSDTFFELAKSSTADGLGALYAYERQIPAVAETKIASLKKFYSIAKPEDLEFFSVHVEADKWHSQECEDLIKDLPPNLQEVAKSAAIKLAKALWTFLDGMEDLRQKKLYINV